MICVHFKGGPKDGQVMHMDYGAREISVGVVNWRSPHFWQAEDESLADIFPEAIVYKRGPKFHHRQPHQPDAELVFFNSPPAQLDDAPHTVSCYEYTYTDGVGIGGIDWAAP